MTSLRIAVISLALLCPGIARAADCATPASRVAESVPIRPSASSSEQPIGRLPKGDQREIISTVPGWYEIQLEGDSSGFVSTGWNERVPCAGAPEPVVAGGAGPSFEVHVIDVGTGLSVLIRGQDFALLYDGGTKEDNASTNRVLDYFEALEPEVERLDHLIVSHPHEDHVELLADLVKEIPTADIWDSGGFNDVCTYGRFLKAVSELTDTRYHSPALEHQSASFRITKQCRGDDLPDPISIRHDSRTTLEPVALGIGASFRFLHTDHRDHSPGEVNRNSQVAMFELGNHKVLIMGDAEAGERDRYPGPPTKSSIEGKLLACCRADLKADVMVVGHHGSKTSSRPAFLDAVDAEVFLISSGPYEYSDKVLPDQTVKNELASRGEVWSTAEDDGACKASQHKVGPDQDDQPGGCKNILVRFTPAGISAEYFVPEN